MVGLLDELDALENSIAAHDLELRGLMRISSPTAFGVQALRRALADFMRTHPELTMELTLNDGPVNPVDEGYDMVITDRGGISGQFQEEPLFRFDLLCCAAPSYLQARGVPQLPADLREHDCIQYLYHESGHEWRFGEGQQVHRVQVHPRLTTNSGALMHDAAVEGEAWRSCRSFWPVSRWKRGRLVEDLPGYTPAAEDDEGGAAAQTRNRASQPAIGGASAACAGQRMSATRRTARSAGRMNPVAPCRVLAIDGGRQREPGRRAGAGLGRGTGGVAPERTRAVALDRAAPPAGGGTGLRCGIRPLAEGRSRRCAIAGNRLRASGRACDATAARVGRWCLGQRADS